MEVWEIKLGEPCWVMLWEIAMISFILISSLLFTTSVTLGNFCEPQFPPLQDEYIVPICLSPVGCYNENHRLGSI